VRRPPPRILALVLLFCACAAAGLFAAARSRTDAALARDDLATAAAIQDRLAWFGLDDGGRRYAIAHALLAEGRLDEAAAQFERGLARAPDGEQWAALAGVHVRRGDPEAAIRAWERGFETNRNPRYMHRASRLLIERGEPERAFACFVRAVLVEPPSAMLHARIANMARLMGLPVHEIEHLRAALVFEPGRPTLRHALAWRLATREAPPPRDAEEAVQLAEALVAESERRDASALDLLGAALAAAGRFDAALLAAAEAHDLAARTGDDALAASIQQRLALYRARRPFVQVGAAPPG
jgi:tetratricopeptide (TPR) repeat protein